MRYGKALAGLGLVLSAGVPLAVRAQATTPGAYVGVGAGQDEAKKYQCDLLPTCKKKGTVYKLFGGWQFHRNFAVELGYTDLGNVSSNQPGTFDERLTVGLGEATMVGFIHAGDRGSIFGRVGVYYAHSSDTVTLNGTTQTFKKNNGNPTFGAGLQYFFTPSLAVRAEGQRYMKVSGQQIGERDWNAYTVGLLWKFW